MIDKSLIVSGGIKNSGELIYQGIFSLNPTSIFSTQSDNSIDLSAARELGSGKTLFLRMLISVFTVISPATTITVDIRGANQSSLLDWTILASTQKLDFKSFAERGYFSLPVQPSSSTYRYLYARYMLENSSAINANLFADFSLEPVMPGKYYPSGWVMA